MVGPAEQECLLDYAGRCLDPQVFCPLIGNAVAVAISISRGMCRIIKLLFIDILQVRIVICQTPAQELVVAYIQERKPKLRQSRKIQSLFAVKMSFVILAHTKEGLMGI